MQLGKLLWETIDIQELHKFVQELEAEGMIRFEALRYASTMLK